MEKIVISGAGKTVVAINEALKISGPTFIQSRAEEEEEAMAIIPFHAPPPLDWLEPIIKAKRGPKFTPKKKKRKR